jgi:predicted amidohydrolase
MANRIKISTIGASALSVDVNATCQDMAHQMQGYWDAKLQQVLPDHPDLIVVPEMCDLPESLSNEKELDYYQQGKDLLFEFFAGQAKKNNCYLVYPTIRTLEDNTRRNSCIVIDRQGRVAGIYDKNHIVLSENSEKGIQCGDQAPLIDCDFGKMACAICFDLNFEPLRSKYIAAEPDLLVFPSLFHGGLQQAWWAFSCRCHFVGAVTHDAGPSQIRNPHGHVLATTTNYVDYVTATVNLDCKLVHLDENREKLVALKEKYKTQVDINDPGLFGSVLVTSESGTVDVNHMLGEFNIEVLDDYLQRSLRFHQSPNSSCPFS